MNLGQITNQIVLMFCLMLVGVIINKFKFMHAQTSNDLTNILLYVVSPCLIINAFEQDYSNSRTLMQLTVILSNYSCLRAISHTLLQITLTYL